MTDKLLPVNGEVHELKLGTSFDSKPKVAYHSIRYDFKPASVDTTQEGTVEVGEGHSISVSLPHVEGAGTSHTIYKGNKRPCPKECVLIIDHETGTFTLERLSNTLNLKKTRIEGSSKITQGSRPLTPVDINKQKASPAKNKNTPSNVSPPLHTESPSITPVHDEAKKDSLIGYISESSSSDSSSDSDNSGSDSEDEKDDKTTNIMNINQNTHINQNIQSSIATESRRPLFSTTVSQDLLLSESSDSD